MAKNIELDFYNIYETLGCFRQKKISINNCSIFHPTIYAKQMEDENAKWEHGSSSRVRLKLIYQLIYQKNWPWKLEKIL